MDQKLILCSSTLTRAEVDWAQLMAVREGTPIEIWGEYRAAAAIEELVAPALTSTS